MTKKVLFYFLIFISISWLISSLFRFNSGTNIDSNIIFNNVQNYKCPVCAETKKALNCSIDRSKNFKENLIFEAEIRKYIGCTFKLNGGIGNQIWRFASLYGIGKYLEREPFFDATNSQQIKDLTEISTIFPMMTEILQLKSISEKLIKQIKFAEDCCQFDYPTKLSNFSDKYIKIKGNHLQSYKYFHEFRNEIRTIFKCGLLARNSITQFASKMFGSDTSHKFCVHTRLGDFVKDVMLESTPEFTIPAIKFAQEFLKMQTKNSDISILFIRNEKEFIKNLSIENFKFKNVYISETQTRGNDLCFGINYCDSMLLTASGSTFGWWISYLMKSGSTIFYNSQVSDYGNFSKDIHDFDYFPPEWIMLTVKNGTAKREKKWWHQRHNLKPDLLDEQLKF